VNIHYSDASRPAPVVSSRMVTYLIIPVMTSWVTWRSNTPVELILVRGCEDDDAADDDYVDRLPLLLLLLMLCTPRVTKIRP